MLKNLSKYRLEILPKLFVKKVFELLEAEKLLLTVHSVELEKTFSSMGLIAIKLKICINGKALNAIVFTKFPYEKWNAKCFLNHLEFNIYVSYTPYYKGTRSSAVTLSVKIK